MELQADQQISRRIRGRITTAGVWALYAPAAALTVLMNVAPVSGHWPEVLEYGVSAHR